MKLLLISSIYPNKANPMQGIYIKRIHEMYEELGIDVDCVVYEGGRNKLSKIYRMLKYIISINRKIKSDKYDVINVQYPFISAIPFRLIKLKTPLITTIHGSDINYNTYLKRWLGGFTVDLLRKSDTIIVNTNFFRKVVLNKVDISARKIKLSPAGGYDGSVFYPKETSEESYDSEKIYWVGFAARLIEKKGWRIILDAFLRLKQDEKFSNVGLMIAGDGPDFKKVIQEVNELELKLTSKCIKVLGGLSEKALADFYRSLDVFVFPTQFQESLGLVGIESLACGTPVIASDIGGIEEYMIDGVNGYLIEPSNAESLLDALKRYLTLSEMKKADMKMNAVISVANYEKNKVAVSLKRIIEEVLV